MVTQQRISTKGVGQNLSALADTWADKAPDYFGRLRVLGQAFYTEALTPWEGASLWQEFSLDVMEKELRRGSAKVKQSLNKLRNAQMLVLLGYMVYLMFSLVTVSIRYQSYSSRGAMTLAAFWASIYVPALARLGFVTVLGALATLVELILYIIRNNRKTKAEQSMEEDVAGARRTVSTLLAQASSIMTQTFHNNTVERYGYFINQTNAVLEALKEEQARSQALVDEREREAKDLTLFTSELKDGAKSLLESFDRLQPVYESLDSTVTDLHAQSVELNKQQENIFRSIEDTRAGFGEMKDTLSRTVETLESSVSSVDSALDRSLVHVDETKDLSLQLGNLAESVTRDYTALAETWVRERAVEAEIADDLQDTVSAVLSTGEALEGTIDRIERIEEHAKVTMHLSAQVVDDFATHNQRMHTLSQAMADVTTGLRETTSELTAHQETSRTLMQSLSEEGSALAGLWETGHRKWLNEVSSAAERTSGTLRAQGVEISKTGDVIREALGQLEGEYKRLQKASQEQQALMEQQHNFYQVQLREQTDKLDQSVAVLTKAMKALTGETEA